MLIGCVLAALVARGVAPAVVAVVALAVFRPVWFLVGAAGWAAWHRIRRLQPASADAEVALFQAIAAELRAGASLRSALVEAASRSPELELGRATRLAGAGLPAADVAAALERELAGAGRLAATAFTLAADTGAKAADVFASLAARAADAAELARETRAMTAQARLSSLVVGGAPLLLAGVLFATGRADTLFDAGALGLGIAAVGVGLEIAGLAVIWWMLRRALP